MENLDINAYKLRKRLRERGIFAPGKMEFILNKNPFDINHIVWEQQCIYNDKRFAYIIKKNFLIPEDEFITEFSGHPDDNISQYLANKNKIVISAEAEKIHINYNSIILIKDLLFGEKNIIKKLDLKRTTVVMGVCTKNPHYYERCRKFYEEVIDGIKVDKIEDTATPQKLYIVKTKRTS